MSADAGAIVFNTVLRFPTNLYQSGRRSFHYRFGSDIPARIDGSPIEVATADNESSTSGDGTVGVPADGSYGFFSMATVNVGASGDIEVVPSIAGSGNGRAVICQTNPADGTCIADPGASVTLQMAASETATFAVFVRSQEPVVFDPARNRVNLSFVDAAEVNRGRTSLALR